MKEILKKLDAIPLTGKDFSCASMKGLSNEEFSKLRDNSKSYGGSDAPVILGISPFKTPYELAIERMEGVKQEHSDYTLSLFETGHKAEAYVRNYIFPTLAKKELGELGKDFIVLPFEFLVRTKDYPFLHACIDGLIITKKGEVGIYEGKTLSLWNYNTQKDYQKGRIPLYYETQMRFYMQIISFFTREVLGKDISFAYICCAWGLRPQEGAAIQRIERNKPLDKAICGKCSKFAEETKDGVLPDVDKGTLNAVSNFFNKFKGEDIITIEAGDDDLINELVSDYQTLKTELKNKEDAIKEQLKPLSDEVCEKKQALLAMLYTNNAKGAETSQFQIKYEFGGRHNINRKLLEEKYPDVFNEVYQKTENSVPTFKVLVRK